MERASHGARADSETGRSRWTVYWAPAGVVIWFILMRRFRDGDVYAAIGAYSLAVLAVSLVLTVNELKAWFAPSVRSIGSGMLVGAVMTAATYPVFRLAVAAYPPLEQEVAALYFAANQTTALRALGWLLAIVLAEEVLFRGVLVELLDRHFRPAISSALCVLAYMGAQLGTRSWVVALMAILCGSIWMLQRRWTDSVLSPFVAHLVWTPTVIVLAPVV